MSENDKGSALPRGLSSAVSVYLAPTDFPDYFRVAVRHSPKDISYFLAKETELQDWIMAEAEDHRHTLRDQLRALGRLYDNQETKKPRIMGILNVTPDSFSDGGQHFEKDTAVARAKKMVSEGAAILDIGGESTRPGADAVSIALECERVVPVIEECREMGVDISIDTRKKAVMEAANKAGATMINDVTALEYDAESLDFVAASGLPVCLMHSSADPKVMQDNPQYDNVVFDVIDYLKQRIAFCVLGGIPKDRIIIDPGIGFGKTVDHNLQLLNGLPFFHSLGCEVLLGASRKSFIGKISDEPVAENRVAGSVAAALYGLKSRVQILRVHDVAETRQAVDIWQSVSSASF